jgi:WD40 repeat protein
VGELAVGDAASTVSVYSRWRARHSGALLIVDQFEELFTLNAAEEQGEFAELLGRLALEADVFVLLSMRDDFLMECRDHPPLEPIFSDLTALPSLTGGNLRRAMVQPAARCGYRFEDDELVEEMLAEVEGERGALPMLAFAMSRLWEKRDRDNGFLTRQAYRDIGGVGGALARHAEATIDRVGSGNLPIVRELFRNLVAAEGTRAVREWNELVSIFRDSRSESRADEVLRQLIDARLLTSYEVREEDEAPTRRVEIIHESLLASWPRLVGWQTQDADSARMRDELRQAARTWDEHDRSDDRLWTGTAYREYQVWRERYPGGLTELEEAFGTAMTRHAERRRRRRRAVVAATIVFLLAVLAIIGGFWRRSVSETRRAEAANLLSLAQIRLEDHPSDTIAFAIASLELRDSPEVRRLVVEALWRGPTEFRLPTGSPYSLDFSPDGRWLATATAEDGIKLWPSDGGPPTALDPQETGDLGRISPRGDLIAYNSADMKEVRLWSFPAGRFLRSLHLGGTYNQLFWFSRDGGRLITSTENLAGNELEVMIRSWPIENGDPDLLARLAAPKESGGTFFGVDPTESLLAWVEGSRFNLAPLDGMGTRPTPSVSLEHDQVLTMAVFDDEGRQLATADASGTIRVWSLESDSPKLIRAFAGAGTQYAWSLRFNPSGEILGSSGGYLGDLAAPPNAEPIRLRRSGDIAYGVAFHPEGTWFATGYFDSVSLWPLARPYPEIIRAHEEDVNHLRFTPDGNWLVSTSDDGTVRLWPLGGGAGQRSRTLYQARGAFEVAYEFAMAPDGSFVVIGTGNGSVWVLPLDGGPSRELISFTDVVMAVAVDPESRFVAGGAGISVREEAIVRVWDLASGETRTLDAGDGAWIRHLEFAGDGDLWVVSGSKLRRWNVAGPRPGVVEEVDLESSGFASVAIADLDPDGRQVLLRKGDTLWIRDLDTGSSLELSSHSGVRRFALGPTGKRVISSDTLGAVRIGPVTGEEAHLLLGHEPLVYAFAVSPDGRWIATGGDDRTIRLWPMPDLSKPPLHTLPREELIAKLNTLTNLRAVRDEVSPTGWKVEVGPFPGWQYVPEW